MFRELRETCARECALWCSVGAMLGLSFLQGGAVVGARIHTWSMDEASYSSRHPPMHSFTDIEVKFFAQPFCEVAEPSGEPTASLSSVSACVMDFGAD